MSRGRYLHGMLSKQNRDIFVNWKKILERVSIYQFPGSLVGEEVGNAPVGVEGMKQVRGSSYHFLLFRVNFLSANITIDGTRGRERKWEKWT